MWRDEDCFEDGDSYDPLFLVRGRRLEDEEAELIESLCQAATPGPWVTDDASEGGGALIATLPDGRSVVSSRAPESCPEAARRGALATAQLICETRCMLLRLLRDRQWRKHREHCLLDKVHELEEQLEQQTETLGHRELLSAASAPSRPR